MSRAPVLALVAAALLCAPRAARAQQANPPRVAQVTIEGRTLEPAEQLQRFLGLEPGARYDTLDALEGRVGEALEQLGYQKLDERWQETPAGLEVRLKLEPARLVRHVVVHGNWPVLDSQLKRHLTLRPGSRLPPEAELSALLDREAQRIEDFLRRDGYFDGEVTIDVRRAGQPEWVDLYVKVKLGRWFRLSAVTASGNHVLDSNDLLRYFGSRKPWWFGRLRLESLRDDARDAEARYRELGYPAARVLPEFDPKSDLDRKSGQAKLRVQVTEKAKVEVRFQGNEALADSQLREKLTIYSSGSYDDVELRESARELLRLYQANGYLQAQITYSRTRRHGVEEIVFSIVEGPELKVRRVDFQPAPGRGPLSVDEKTLREQVTTKVFPRIGELGLGQGGYVSTVQLQQDAQRIVDWYKAHGHPDAQVEGQLARTPDALGRAGVLAADFAAGDQGRGQDLYVRFVIDEGHAEQLGEVRIAFRGKNTLDATALREAMALPAGTPYDVEALARAIKRIPERYARVGHPYASIAPPLLTWNADHSRVDVDLLVDEGPEVRFGQILVRGNFKTSDWVIRRDLPFRAGDLFDLSQIEVAERNLQTHGIFNGVRVIPVGLSAMVNPVPILVEVQQERYDDWGGLVLSVGYSTDVGLSLQPGYFWGNVFGGGGQLDLTGEAAFDFTQTPATASELGSYTSPFYRRLALSLRYIHPHLIWPSLRSELGGFVRKENTVRLGEVDSGGATTSLTWVAGQRFRLFARYNWTLSSLQSIDFQRLPGRGDSLSVVADQTRTGKLTVGAVFDDRLSLDGARNPLMPARGWLLAGSFAVAGHWLGGNHDFLVASGQVQRYQPLGAGLTLIVNLRGDWGIPLGEPALPAIERFYAGGDVATRGYATDMLRTEVIRYDVSPAGPGSGFKIIPQGGNIRFLGTIELQFPITTIAGFPWVGGVFADAGTVFDAPRLFRFSHDMKFSVGLTLLRLLTPIGPISLEYGYPLTRGPAEEQWKSAPWYRHWPGMIHFNWGIPILR